MYCRKVKEENKIIKIGRNNKNNIDIIVVNHWKIRENEEENKKIKKIKKTVDK